MLVIFQLLGASFQWQDKIRSVRASLYAGNISAVTELLYLLSVKEGPTL